MLKKEKEIRITQLKLFRRRKYTLENFITPLKIYISKFYKLINRDQKSSASLILENENVPFKGGIIYTATPPSKKFSFGTESLSSGELTLANLALFFAVNEILDSPFLIFDETDTHLDFKNIIKFSNFIQKIKKNKQMIFVTHKPFIFEKLDSVIGVTRTPKQSSEIFTIKANV